MLLLFKSSCSAELLSLLAAVLLAAGEAAPQVFVPDQQLGRSQLVCRLLDTVKRGSEELGLLRARRPLALQQGRLHLG